MQPGKKQTTRTTTSGPVLLYLIAIRQKHRKALAMEVTMTLSGPKANNTGCTEQPEGPDNTWGWNQVPPPRTGCAASESLGTP
eukprot:scaffold40600_cov17-Tisochrysis_lutea.AAC.2